MAKRPAAREVATYFGTGPAAFVDTWAGSSLDPERIRALALAATHAQFWKGNHDELAYRRSTGGDSPREVCIDTLRDWWSVTSRDEALDMVSRLAGGIHAGSYEVVHPLVMEAYADDGPAAGAQALTSRHRDFLIEAARFHGHGPRYFVDDYDTWLQALKLGVLDHIGGPLPSDIRAWDLGRVTLVTRLAYTAGFLDEEECWPVLLDALDRAREVYSNWRQFGQSLHVGGVFWRASQDLSEVVEDSRNRRADLVGMLERTLSPWRRFELHPDGHPFTITPRHRVVPTEQG